jgi:hypothetical protein
MYDIFVAELQCPNCRTVHTADAYTNMQTYIRSYPDSSAIGIGFIFEPRELTTKNIINARYKVIAEPPPGGPIRLLNTWTCPACNTEQWAMVTIADGRLQQVEGVTMSRATLEAANFIPDIDADLLAERYASPDAENSIDILRRHLP